MAKVTVTCVGQSPVEIAPGVHIALHVQYCPVYCTSNDKYISNCITN